MMLKHPTVSITSSALVIRIPWSAVDISQPEITRAKRRLTARDVLELVEAGRLAHRVGKSRAVRSLRELIARVNPNDESAGFMSRPILEKH